MSLNLVYKGNGTKECRRFPLASSKSDPITSLSLHKMYNSTYITLKINKRTIDFEFKNKADATSFECALKQIATLLKVHKDDRYLKEWNAGELFILVTKTKNLNIRIIRFNSSCTGLVVSSSELAKSAVTKRKVKGRYNNLPFDKPSVIHKYLTGKMRIEFLPGRLDVFNDLMGLGKRVPIPTKKEYQWNRLHVPGMSDAKSNVKVAYIRNSGTRPTERRRRRLKAQGLKDTPISRLLLEIQDLQ